VREHLASLLDEGGDRCRPLVLPGHADLQNLLGLLPSGLAAKRRQAKGDARCIRGLADPVALAHAEQRFDGIGADRHSHLIEP
jgi:hypothetical protein